MIRVVARLLRRLGGLAAALIIVVGALSLALRLLLPHADGLRDVIAEALGDHLGTAVSVGELGLSVRGLQPELTLDDAELRDRLNGESLLALETLRVDLNLRASLLALAPRIDGVTLVGARLEVSRDASGRIGIRGLDRLSGGDGGGAAFFLREGKLSLADSEVLWTDVYAGVPPLQFRVSRADLINRGKRHRLRIDAAQPGDPTGDLTLRADLSGPPDRPETWSGRLYADWRGSDLARVLRGRLPAQYRLATDALHLTSWSRLAEGRLEHSVNRVWLDDLVLRRNLAASSGDAPTQSSDAPGATDPPTDRLALGDVGALLRWERDGDGWRIDVPELKLFGGPPGGERTALWLRSAPAEGSTEASLGRRLEAGFDGLPLTRLAELIRFAAPQALPRALQTVLAGRIAGELEGLRVRIERPPDAAGEGAAPRWLVQGGIRGLGIGPAPTGAETPAPAGPIPPLDGLDLRFSATPDRGTIDIGGADLHLDLRPYTIEPFRLTRVAGRLHWHRDPDLGVDLWTQALAADTPDLTTLSRLRLRLPPGRSPEIDLHSHIRGGDADAMPRYLPAAQMDDQLEAWLDQAIVAGQMTSADLLLRGPLADFPFDGGNGWFRLELRIRDGVLDYQPAQPRAIAAAGHSSAETGPDPAPRGQWPPLEDMDVTLRFDRRGLDIDLSSARILDTQITGGRARIPDLWRPDAIEIRAEGDGPLTDGLAFLADTPLAERLGGIPKALAAQGSGRLALQLDIPLRRGRSVGYAGQLRFAEDALVSLRDMDLRLTDIDGELDFDNAGIRADGIRARLDEQPLQIDIATRGKGAADKSSRTEITARGETDIETLAKALPGPWWALADGRLAWRLQASLDNDDVQAANPPLALSLTSDLAGIAIDLPAPFGKGADSTRQLDIATRLVPHAPLEVSGRLGELGARLELRQRDGRLAPSRAAVDLNRLPDALPDTSGISLRGRLRALQLGPWLDWRREHATLVQASGGTGAPGGLPLLPVRLAADTLEIGALRFADMEAALTPTDTGGWRIGIETADNSASISLPGRAADGAIAIRLDSLDLAPLLDSTRDQAGSDQAGSAQTGSGQAGDSSGPDPRELPPLRVQIENLRRGERTLGRLHLDVTRVANGLRFADFSLSGPLVSADGTGEWTRDQTDHTETSIDVRLRSDDLGELLRSAGFYSALAGAPSKAALSLTWPAGPGGFSLSHARGSLTADIGAGRILDIEPGVGRVLGILSLGALERRLALDFSDVVDDGFAFDSIEGRVGIANGEARIRQLEILAPTADIRLSGSTELVEKTFEQRARVTPKIGTGVAIAGAVAGGPLVGAAVLLADKVSGDRVSQLASYEYSITGPWAAPVVRRVAGNGTIPSLPDLLLPEQATSRGDGRPPDAAATGAARSPRGESQDSERPVSPFLQSN